MILPFEGRRDDEKISPEFKSCLLSGVSEKSPICVWSAAFHFLFLFAIRLGYGIGSNFVGR